MRRTQSMAGNIPYISTQEGLFSRSVGPTHICSRLSRLTKFSATGPRLPLQDQLSFVDDIQHHGLLMQTVAYRHRRPFA